MIDVLLVLSSLLILSHMEKWYVGKALQPNAEGSWVKVLLSLVLVHAFFHCYLLIIICIFSLLSTIGSLNEAKI